MLTKDEIADIDRRIQRAGASNCWTGTNGSLAADARRLVRHIQETAAVCEYPVDHILRGERELRDRHFLGDEAAILTEDDVADLADETRKAADIGGSVVPQPETAGKWQCPLGLGCSHGRSWSGGHDRTCACVWQKDITKRAATAIAPHPPEAPSAAVRLLDDARAAVIDRHGKYGPPMQHFGRTVGMVNAAFADVLKRPLTPADWALVMVLDKVARHMGTAKTSDTPIDLAGYAACLAECEATA